jgi:hypothetical protein
MKTILWILLMLLFTFAAKAQIADQDIRQLETRLSELVKKDRSFKEAVALKFYHIFNLEYKGRFNMDTFSDHILQKENLSPLFIRINRKQFVSAQSLIVNGEGKLAGGDADMVIFYNRYSSYYLNMKNRLLQMIQQNNFRFVFRLSIDKNFPLDIFWGVNDQGVNAIIQENDSFKLMPGKEFLKCCMDTYYPGLKNNEIKN